MHARGIVHGDLKLSNIMIDSAASVRLIDFGYSTALANRKQAVTCYSGTPVYLAPEVIRQEPYDGGSDQGSRPTCGRWAFCFSKC